MAGRFKVERPLNHPEGASRHGSTFLFFYLSLFTLLSLENLVTNSPRDSTIHDRLRFVLEAKLKYSKTWPEKHLRFVQSLTLLEPNS